MNIFDKRPLSLILCISLAAFVIFSFNENLYARIAVVAIILCVGVGSFARPCNGSSKVKLTRLTAVFSLVAVIFSFVYFDLWFKAYDRYDEEKVTINGIIEEFDTSSYQTKIYLRTTDVNDTAFSRYDLIVYVDKSEYYGFSIGSEVKIVGVIENFTTSGDFDSVSYFTSKGFSGVVNDVTSFEMTDVGDYTLTYKINRFRSTICSKIIMDSETEEGGLLCALLMGERDYLPLGTRLDFTRCGISHMLALSGMHLAILAIGISKLLIFLGLGKKSSTALTILFTILYMTVTGFSVSVVRAGVMLIVSSILYLLSRTKDSMTSLLCAVTLITIVTPYAIFDNSLWLSAFATLGIVVLSEYQSKKYSKPSFFKWVISSIMASFFAIAATFSITTVNFDATSLLAPIMTLALSPLVELYIYIGLFLLLFGSIIPVRYVFTPIGRVFLNIVDYASDMKWSYVSTNFISVIILSLIFSIGFFAFLILNIKHKKIFMSVLAVSLVSILAISSIKTYSVTSATKMTYFSTTNDQVLITDSDEICFVDIANYKEKSSYAAYATLADNNITYISKYVLTNYSYYLDDSLPILINNILIEEIYIPAPQNKDEETIFFQVDSITRASDIKLTVYENEDVISVGDMSLIPLYSYKLGSSKKNMFTVLYNNEFHTYLGIDMLKYETKSMAYEIMSNSDSVIIGRHESKNYNFTFNFELENAEKIVFSSEKLIFSEDVFEYYEEKESYFSPERVEIIR